MKILHVLSLSAVLLSSCAVKKQIVSFDSPMIEEINLRAATDPCELGLYGQPIRPQEVVALQIGKDSIRWQSHETLLNNAIPAKDLTSVRFTDHGQGAVDGLLNGGIGGAVFGALFGLASGNDRGFMSFTAGEKAGILGVVFGLVGAIGGVVGGAITGAKTEYIMPRQ